ncbi:MAG: hypothetical protein PHF89_05645 [Eubacteriales bacterium]|nr:hypothetical protein [Eubacteriales bacterium]
MIKPIKILKINLPKLQSPQALPDYTLKPDSLPADVFQTKVIDIYSKGEYPGNILSNFTRCLFHLDGVKICSIEGFLQSLKTNRPEIQLKTCTCANAKAKRMGTWLNNFHDRKTVYWQGQAIDRFSEDYQTLLRRVYDARLESDGFFRQALKDSMGYKLIHSIGKQDPATTILTESEFISNLERLRTKIK